METSQKTTIKAPVSHRECSFNDKNQCSGLSRRLILCRHIPGRKLGGQHEPMSLPVSQRAPAPGHRGDELFSLIQKYINKVNAVNYRPICTAYLRN